MNYYHVDVFSATPLAGNGLTVVFPEKKLEASVMLRIAQEFKQFETIFLYPESDKSSAARIFTTEEELNFAGHPIVGASAVLYHLSNSKEEKQKINIRIDNRIIATTARTDSKNNICVEMNQGQASFIDTLNIESIREILPSLNLQNDDINPDYPIEVVSTGLPYLILPVKDEETLSRVKILADNFEEQLEEVGAKFVYVFEPNNLECRTWDNLGNVEDIATGSAAGPLCAYLVKNGFKSPDEKIIIKQGKFINRNSEIQAWVDKANNEVKIGGTVSFFAKGSIML